MRFHGDYPRGSLFQPEKLVGKRRQEVARNPDDEAFWAEHNRHLEQHLPFSNFVYPVSNFGGGTSYVTVNGSPVFDADGQFRGYRGTARDVTPLVESQQRNEALTRELQDRIQESEGELSRRNPHLDIFASSIAHDLRAPLITIQGFGGMVLSQDGPELSEEGRRRVERMLGAAREMGETLDDLLELSRVAKWCPRLQPVDLSRIAREVAGELQKEEPNRNVELKLESGLVLESDPDLTRLLLRQLMTNAWKFTRGRDGAAIQVVRARHEGYGQVVCVRDNGAGFVPPTGITYSEPFRKFHSKGEFPGRGMGFAVCQRAMERLGGTLWVESTLNEGTSVYFTAKFIGETSFG